MGIMRLARIARASIGRKTSMWDRIASLPPTVVGSPERVYRFPWRTGDLIPVTFGHN